MSPVNSPASYWETLECIAIDIIRPNAAEIDQTGASPREAINALGKSGVMGLISAFDNNGNPDV